MTEIDRSQVMTFQGLVKSYEQLVVTRVRLFPCRDLSFNNISSPKPFSKQIRPSLEKAYQCLTIQKLVLPLRNPDPHRRLLLRRIPRRRLLRATGLRNREAQRERRPRRVALDFPPRRHRHRSRRVHPPLDITRQPSNGRVPRPR